MPFSPIKVANEFVRLAQQQGGPSLTPLQLIKLTYMAHGWSFVFLEEPLLNEPVQAWQYGPVLPSLYYAVRHYRASPVADVVPGDSDPQPLSDRARELIAAVYQRYRHLSGTQLSAMTHMANTPWSQAWHERGQNSVIPNNAIADHYRERYQALAAQ
jgi:uncharacterized phage-associated protein